MTRNTIALPQVSSGVARNVLLAIWRDRPEERISKEWLEERRFSQAPQILEMLSFLGMIERPSGRLREEVRGCLGDAKGFYRVLRGLVVEAYASAGLGTAETLGWLGRDRLDDRQLRVTIEGKGPFRLLDSGAGGAKNARSCLKGLHGFLVEWRRRYSKGGSLAGGGKGDARPAPAGSIPRSEDSTRGDSEPETRVLHERFADLRAARDFVRQLPDASRAEADEDQRVIRVPFADGQGTWTTALVCFRAGPGAEHLLGLGRMLQTMGEEMERRAASSPTP